MSSNDLPPALRDDSFFLVLAGERVDGRTVIARCFKSIASDIYAQLGGNISPSEKLLLKNAATFAVLCERDSARLLSGEGIDEENFRRNVTTLNSCLMKLGLAAQSRDVTKSMRQSRAFDAPASAVLDAD